MLGVVLSIFLAPRVKGLSALMILFLPAQGKTSWSYPHFSSVLFWICIKCVQVTPSLEERLENPVSTPDFVKYSKLWHCVRPIAWRTIEFLSFYPKVDILKAHFQCKREYLSDDFCFLFCHFYMEASYRLRRSSLIHVIPPHHFQFLTLSNTIDVVSWK